MRIDKKVGVSDGAGVLVAEPIASTLDYLGYSLKIDPLKVEFWRLPEILAWIRSITKSFAPPDREQFVKDAREVGEGAFHLIGPRSGDIRLEGRLLLDRAARGEIELHSPAGIVQPHYLGPSALILPRGITFAIWPWQHAMHDEHILDVWCERQHVQRLWRSPELTTIGSESKCQHWLEKMMRASPRAPDRPKAQYQVEAIRRFPALGKRSFSRAWEGAIKSTGAVGWSHPGRKAHRTGKAHTGN